MANSTSNLKIRPIKNAPEFTSVEILPGRNVRLSWCDAVGADKYVIVRFSTVEDEVIKEKLEVLDVGQNSYVDTTIEDDGLFEYKVIAKKKLGPKQWARKLSRPVRANIVSVEAPVLDSIENIGKSIKISWNKDENIYGYVVLRRFSFMKKAIPIATLANGENEYTDKKFAEGQLLYYSIQSIISDGDSFSFSKPSNELCSTILPVPHILKKKKNLTGKVTVSVRLCAGADGYILFRRKIDDEKPKEISRTKGIASFDLSDSGKKPHGPLLYSVACFKTLDEENEFIGERSEEIIFN